MSARPVDDIDKIPHQTVVEYPVVKITADTGGEKTKGNVNQFLLDSAEKKKRQNHYQRNNRNHCEQPVLAGSYSESGAVVLRHY